MPSYEFLHGQFRARRGLYILGAGASTGNAPFGQSFMIGPAVDYVREAGGFPAIVPEQSELNRRIIDIATQLPVSRFFPEREFRPGTPEFPYREMLHRLPGFYARLLLKHTLSTARFSGRQSDNYRVFELFRSGTILNYNLDGLATEICSRFHRVLAVHGTIQPGYGSPRAVEIIAAVRELDLPVPPDDLLLCIPESHDDEVLKRRLRAVTAQSAEFIAIIGYSFGRQGSTYDDYVSLCWFERTFREFRGDVFIIGPEPEETQFMIADRLKSNKVIGVHAYWNILAHAFMNEWRGSGRKSLSYSCGEILDKHGSLIAFPN